MTMASLPSTNRKLADALAARGIWVILLGYLTLAVVYSLVTPIFEAPDEPQHFWVVKHLADGNGLPVQGQGEESGWEQEGSQPPLYYMLSALLISGLDTSDLPQLLWRNPHANMGVPLKEGNKNIYIHTARERFPYRGATLVVHLVRLLSLLMGAGTVLATYATMRLTFPDKRYLALGAAALNAFTPQFLFLSGAVNNDNLVILVSSWMLWALLRLWARPLRWREGVLLGILAGVGALAKLSGLGLLALLGLALLFLGWQRKDWRGVCKIGVVAFGIAAAIAGWWYARNCYLYGDPTGLKAMLDVFGRRQISGAALLGELEGLRISYWAIFGWFNILSWPPLYKMLDGLFVVAVAGFALWLMRAWRSKSFPQIEMVWVALSLGWAAIILAALLRWTRMTSGTQGRLLFPAISAFSGLIIVGLSEWLPRSIRPRLAAGLGGLFFLWAALCPFIHIAPAYALPPIVKLEAIPQQTQPAHITFGDELELLAVEFDETSLTPGETLRLTAYWRALDSMTEDYSLYVHLFGREGQAIGQLDSYPGGGSFPTSLWKPGDIIRDRYAVRVSPDALTPAAARVNLGVYLLSTGDKLAPIRDAQGRSLISPTVGRVRIAPQMPLRSQAVYPASLDLGGQVRFLGYDLDKTKIRPGESFTVTLYWQALKPLPADYTVFVHLAGTEIVAQGDGQPYGGDYPTSIWAVGEVVADSHVVQVKSEVKPGVYQLLVGLYRLDTQERLPVIMQNQPQTDHISLAQIAVSW
jgi:4-amino-4-deoxy-L-arabinose transferase-like glycosyltransferase